MAYIGKNPSLSFSGIARYDSFTGDGSTTTFDLTYATLNGGQNDIQVFVDNVRQEPGASKSYTLGLDGSNDVKRITFVTAPGASSAIYVISPGRETALLQPGDNAVTTAKIQDNAVTVAKLATTLDLSSNTVTLPSSFTTNTGTQTLTNKTISGASNTLSNIGNASLTNSGFTLNGTSISLGDTAEISAGTSWQAVKTSGFTAVAGEGYFCNTTSAAFTVTLPASPTLGDEISIVDYAGTFDTNNLTIGRNGNPIQGSAADLTVSTERAGFTLVYVDGTQGWLLKDK
jgi:hypothetical protein